MNDRSDFPLIDPRDGAVAPEAQTIEQPGRTAQLDPVPDHGETTYAGSGKLEGRRALVTGGDSGIGRAVSLAFAREGADVSITCLEAETDDAAVTRGLIQSAGRIGSVSVADLSQDSACHDVVARTVDDLGGLDVLVCNAAYQMSLGSVLDLTADQLRHTFATNVFSTIWLVQAALAHMPEGASVVITSSIQATSPSPELLDYAATKAALVNLTKSLSLELVQRGIRVNGVAPGPVWTPLIPATMPESKVEGFGAETPLGRVGQPSELAPAYVFLASNDSSYITGETIAVTGGRLTPN